MVFFLINLSGEQNIFLIHMVRLTWNLHLILYMLKVKAIRMAVFGGIVWLKSFCLIFINCSVEVFRAGGFLGRLCAFPPGWLLCCSHGSCLSTKEHATDFWMGSHKIILVVFWLITHTHSKQCVFFIPGVPTFYFNGQKMFSGAQEPEVFKRMFEIAAEKFPVETPASKS